MSESDRTPRSSNPDAIKWEDAPLQVPEAWKRIFQALSDLELGSRAKIKIGYDEKMGKANISVTLNVSQQETERLFGALPTEFLNPEKGEEGFKIVSEDKTQSGKAPEKLWAATERKKRSKPKTDTPELP